MTSDAMMPIGRSLFGFLASSAVVDTASKPMYAKKTTAAAAVTPGHPYGANGDQFFGTTYPTPTMMKNTTAASLTATMAALKRALSRTPITRSVLMRSTMSTAGRLITAPSTPAPGEALIQTGR